MALGGCEKGKSSGKNEPSLATPVAQQDAPKPKEISPKSEYLKSPELAEGQKIEFGPHQEHFALFYKVERIGEDTAIIRHGSRTEDSEQSIAIVQARYGVETLVFKDLVSPMLTVEKGTKPGTVTLSVRYELLI